MTNHSDSSNPFVSGFGLGFGGCLGVLAAIAFVIFAGIEACRPHFSPSVGYGAEEVSAEGSHSAATEPIAINGSDLDRCQSAIETAKLRVRGAKGIGSIDARPLSQFGDYDFCFANAGRYRIGYKLICLDAKDPKCTRLVSVYDARRDKFLLARK